MSKKHTSVLAALLLFVTSACQSDLPSVGNPRGEPLLPDLMPAPPTDFSTSLEEDGRNVLRFSSILVNVGQGNFILRGTRSFDQWTAEQLVEHTESGAVAIQMPASVVWGGDGHEHWHIGAVAHYWIIPLGPNGEPVDDQMIDETGGMTDSKVGFCFYDHTRLLENGPAEPIFQSSSCGGQDDREFFMGLSPGWSDKYLWELPGQQIDITDLPMGKYRMWTEADPNSWFTEATRDNNMTWADFELSEFSGGRKTALIYATGPES